MLNDTVMNSTDMPDDVRAYIGNGTLTFELAQFAEHVERELHVSINVTPVNVTVWQSNESGYDHVVAQLKARLYLDAGFANWSRDYDNITTLVDIARLSDPYIMAAEPDDILASEPHVNATIVFAQTPIDLTTLESFIVNRSYMYDKYAPSFLQRFSGDLSRSDCFGMESVVALNANLPPTMPLYRRSMVDWCYFSPDYPCRSIDEFKKNYWTLEPGFTTRDPLLPFYSLYLDSYHLRKVGLYNVFVIDQNECRCHIERDEPAYEGPGCIGSAVSEEC